MKDCEKCGEAFDNKTKYGKVCDDCKYKNMEDHKLRKHSGKPYYNRD